MGLLPIDDTLALDSLLVDKNADKKADVGQLDEIPPKAKEAYLQYLPQLQLDADFYLFKSRKNAEELRKVQEQLQRDEEQQPVLQARRGELVGAPGIPADAILGVAQACGSAEVAADVVARTSAAALARPVSSIDKASPAVPVAEEVEKAPAPPPPAAPVAPEHPVSYFPPSDRPVAASG